jgi:hypothetical protein
MRDVIWICPYEEAVGKGKDGWEKARMTVIFYSMTWEKTSEFSVGNQVFINSIVGS